MERACRPLRGLQVGAASAEDEDRLLQRCEPAWRLPQPVVCLSWLRVSSQEGGLAWTSPCTLLPACGQPKSAEDHQSNYPTLDSTPSQRQDPAGSSQDVQSVHSRLDQLLRPLLPTAVATNAAAYRCLPDPLGAMEVQAPARAAQGSKRMAGTGSPCQPSALCPLAVLQCRQPNTGSRVNREVHARF